MQPGIVKLLESFLLPYGVKLVASRRGSSDADICGYINGQLVLLVELKTDAGGNPRAQIAVS